MTAARFAVVGCSCGEHWVVEEIETQATSHCPRCGVRYPTRLLKVQARSETADGANELRARLQAESAGHFDHYREWGTFDEQAAEVRGRMVTNHDTEQWTVDDPVGDDWAASVHERIEETFVENYRGVGLSMDVSEEAITSTDPEDLPMFEQASRVHDRLLTTAAEKTGLDEDAVTGEDHGGLVEQTASPPTLDAHLTVTGQPPVTADVAVGSPANTPLAPSVLWQRLWAQPAIRDRLRDALGPLATLTPGQARGVLVDAGVTALDGAYAARILGFTHDGEVDRTVAEADRLTAQLGTGQTWLNLRSAREDIVTGPLAVLAFGVNAGHIDRPTITLPLPAGFFDSEQVHAKQRRRWLDLLVALSRVADVRLVASTVEATKLDHLHSTEAATGETGSLPPSVNWSVTPRVGSAPHALSDAHAAVDELDPDSSHTSLVRYIASRRGEEALYTDLYERADVSPSAVRQRVGRCQDLGLLSTIPAGETMLVQLTQAGEQFLDLVLEMEQRDYQAELGDTIRPEGSSTAANSGIEEGSEGRVNDPPKPPTKTVSPHSGTREGEGSAGTAAAPAPQGGSDAPASATRFLSLAEHDGLVSAAETGGIAVAEEEAPQRSDPWERRISCPPGTDEVVVSVQVSPLMAYTMTRLAGALLSDELLDRFITADVLERNGDPLGALADGNTYVLHRGCQLGCLPARGADADQYRERLRRARQGLVRRSADIVDEDGNLNRAIASEVLKTAHGLAGTMTRIFDLLEIDVVRELNCPDYTRHGTESLTANIAKTVAKQTAISSKRGYHTGHRVLYEDDAEKRARSLGTPSTAPDDQLLDAIGGWVIRGRGTSRLTSALERLDSYLDDDLQEDGEYYTPLLLRVPVVEAARRSAIAEAARRVLKRRRMTVTRQAVSLFKVLADSPFATAEACRRLGAQDPDHERQIYLDEIRLALSALDPEQILRRLPDESPHETSPGRSAIVHALLAADGWLSTSDLAAAADVTTGTVRNHREFLADLEAIGLVTIEDLGVGRSTLFRFRLPFRDERTDFDPATQPEYLVDHRGAYDAPPTYLGALDGVAMSHGVDLTAEGLWPALSLGRQTAGDLVERWPWLDPWAWVLADLLAGREAPAPPPRLRDGEARLGATPTTVQQSLATTATPQVAD